jgi:hypothetical protein
MLSSLAGAFGAACVFAAAVDAVPARLAGGGRRRRFQRAAAAAAAGEAAALGRPASGV